MLEDNREIIDGEPGLGLEVEQPATLTAECPRGNCGGYFSDGGLVVGVIMETQRVRVLEPKYSTVRLAEIES